MEDAVECGTAEDKAVSPRSLPCQPAPPSPAASPPAPSNHRARGPTRLEALLEIIVEEQRAQAQRINRLQAGIEALNSRLSVPFPPPVANLTSRSALSPVRDRLSEVALDAQLLNELSAVLVRHHDAAAERAIAAQRAQTDVPTTLPWVQPAERTPGQGFDSEPLWRDSRAEARSAAARDAALVERGRGHLRALDEEADAEAEASRLRAPWGEARSYDGMDAGNQASRRWLRPRPSLVASDPAPAVDMALSDADFAALLAEAGTAATAADRLVNLVGMQPAPASVITALPRVALVGAQKEAACPVCLDGLGADPVCLLPCGALHSPHAFHPACIFQWLLRRNSCPVCRSPLSGPCSSHTTVAVPPVLSSARLEERPTAPDAARESGVAEGGQHSDDAAVLALSRRPGPQLHRGEAERQLPWGWGGLRPADGGDSDW